MGVLLGLFGMIVLILFVFGVINIVYPIRRLGMKSRWYGVGIVVVSFIGMGVSESLREGTDPEYQAEQEAKRTTEAQVEQVKSETEIATERYAGLIEEYGRDQAGEMIIKEKDAAFKAKDFERLKILTNASAKAMLQDHERSKQQQAIREAELQKKIDAQFSPWDGSHRVLVAAVEKTLNDPGSFEHLETKTMKGAGWPETFIVRMEYTAKNAFGGRLRKFVLVEVSAETGLIMQVLDEG